MKNFHYLYMGYAKNVDNQEVIIDGANHVKEINVKKISQIGLVETR